MDAEGGKGFVEDRKGFERFLKRDNVFTSDLVFLGLIQLVYVNCKLFTFLKQSSSSFRFILKLLKCTIMLKLRNVIQRRN